jgi:hypothetical protein
VDLGCGVQQSCAACGTEETCFDGGCCTPLDCAGAEDAGLVSGCGAIDLGCGVQHSCSPCGPGLICDQSGACVACQPLTCASYGDAGCNHPDQCGNLLDCCASGSTCQDGTCCPPGLSNQNGICCTSGEVNYRGSCCLPTCNPNLPSGVQNSCGEVIYCGAAP